MKIRGFRVEPREIEIALAALPQVREAAVVVRQVMRQDGAVERSLLACVVPAAADAGVATAAELRAVLAARLPPYMVPAFAFGQALDLLPSGKLDRRSLARWSPLADPGRALEAPRTPLEELLAGLFAEVLGVDRLGVEESFFEHGGHSLAAMRLIARIREALGTELPLHRVFETPTVAALARHRGHRGRSPERWPRRSFRCPVNPARHPCRSPSPSSGSGSSINWSRRARSTTCPPRCICRAGSTARRSPRLWGRWRAATSRCGPDSSRFMGRRSWGSRSR